MTTFTVTTLDDFVGADGQRSLREAVNAANASPDADTIVFAPGLEGGTLVLTGGQLVLSHNVTIDGDSDNNGSEVTISGNDASRIFEITGAGTQVALRDVTLSHGSPQYDGAYQYSNGGAVLLSAGSLALDGVTIADSQAGGGTHDRGGGIYAASGTRLDIANSSLMRNEALSIDGGGGGAIATGSGVTLTISHSEFAHNSAGFNPEFATGGGAIQLGGGILTIEDSRIHDNAGPYGGGVRAYQCSEVHIARTSIVDNAATHGGGIFSYGGDITISDSTIAHNVARGLYDYTHISPSTNGEGGGIYIGNGALSVRNSTITDNLAKVDYAPVPNASGGGIHAGNSASIDIANSIVAGDLANVDNDIHGAIAVSDSHNLLGTIVASSILGDQQNIPAGNIFATIDPAIGGGQANADGVVLLRGNAGNLVLGAADLFAAMPTDQLGHARPQPAGSLADLGASESAHALSTTPSAGNDLLTGTAAGQTISGLDGADRIFGAAGNDTLNGNAGSDVLEGGTGNDRLNGGTGIDTAYYGGSTAIIADLSGATDTVHRGGETDTLTGIEGIVGTRAPDTFRGDDGANWFMGGDGKDLYTGGGGRDTFDFNTVNDSRVGASARDVITDFTHGTDKVDLSSIDADTTRPGDQAFHWVSSAAFTGAPGELGFFTSGANTVIQASNDGDTVGELQIQLTGHPSLSASDFYL